MTIGAEGKGATRISDLTASQEVLDTYRQYGTELDTARVYGAGTTEEYLAKLNTDGFVIDTKCVDALGMLILRYECWS